LKKTKLTGVADMKLDKAFYSPGELGDLLDLSSDTILNYIKSGRLFAVKLSERTYRIPQRAAARLVGEPVAPSRIDRQPRGGAQAAAKIRQRFVDEDRALSKR
jgi:hypothetical protein